MSTRTTKQSKPHFTIYKVGSTYYAQDNWTNTIPYDDSAFATVMNAALGDLSAGRDWQEAIQVLGEVDVAAIIEVPDYTFFDLTQAKLTLTANIAAMFQSENLTSDRVDEVTFWGGNLDGDHTSRTSGTGIQGTFRRLRVIGTNIYSFENYGVQLIAYSAVIRPNMYMDMCSIGLDATGTGNQDGGIFFDWAGAGANMTDCFIDNTFFINNGDFQILGEANWTNMRISNCHFSGFAAGLAVRGIVAEAHATNGDNRRIQIVNCHFEQVMREAILIVTANTKFSDHWLILNNTFEDCARETTNTYDVIRVDDSAGGEARLGVMTNNTFSSIQANKARYAIGLDAGATLWRVKNNIIQSNAFTTGPINVGSLANNINDNYGNVDHYQTQAGGAWVNPTGNPANGTRVMVFNSNIGAHRWYVYSNGGWHYELLT